MNISTRPSLELFVARLLSAGTWTACAVIAIGIAAQFSGRLESGYGIQRIGIGLFIALPVIRLLALTFAFTRAGEKVFAGVCATVILIIALGVVVGVS